MLLSDYAKLRFLRHNFHANFFVSGRFYFSLFGSLATSRKIFHTILQKHAVCCIKIQRTWSLLLKFVKLSDEISQVNSLRII